MESNYKSLNNYNIMENFNYIPGFNTRKSNIDTGYKNQYRMCPCCNQMNSFACPVENSQKCPCKDAGLNTFMDVMNNKNKLSF